MGQERNIGMRPLHEISEEIHPFQNARAIRRCNLRG
jgi:hypothetical protein